MWFKHRAWIPAAWILSAINLAATWPAAQGGEAMHATGHALFAVLFALGAQHLRQRGRTSSVGDISESLEELEARIADMHQLPDVEARFAEIEEHLDFMERALIDARSRAHLPERGNTPQRGSSRAE